MTEEEVFYNRLSQPAYEGASTSYKNGLKGLVKGDADTLAAREIANLQMRIAHAVRNNGYASAARDHYVTSLGAVKINWRKPDGTKHEIMQDFWEEFIEKPNLDGYGDFKSSQEQINSSIFMTGASIIHPRIQRTGNKAKVPLKLQFIPTGNLDLFYNGSSAKDNVKHGIRFNKATNAPETFYFRQSAVSSFFLPSITDLTKPKPLAADKVIYAFQRVHTNQWLGVPSLASVLIPLYELDELKEATVAKQKAAQAISWIVENTNPMSMVATGSPITVGDEEGKEKIVFKTTGGNTQYLNKGEKIHFYQSTDIGANLPVLIKSELMRIAAAVGIPYYKLTGDTSDLDFSSLRAIAIGFRQRIEHIHHFSTIPLTLAPITRVFKELATLYSSEVEDATPTYQLPRWFGVDDLKDAQSDVLELNNGIGTLKQKLAERDLTFEEILASIGQMKELEGALGRPLGATNGGQINNMASNSNSSSN